MEEKKRSKGFLSFLFFLLGWVILYLFCLGCHLLAAARLLQNNEQYQFFFQNMSMHSRLSQTRVLSSQNKNFLLKTTFPDYLGENYYRKPNFEKFYAFFDPAQAVQSFST